jgi:hypothetical protein
MVSSNAQAGIFRSSSHPMVLAALYFFRSAALAVYVLCGLFTDNYVLSVSRRDSFDTFERFFWLNVGLSYINRSSSWSFSSLLTFGTSRFVPLVSPSFFHLPSPSPVPGPVLNRLTISAERSGSNSGRPEVLERSGREWRFRLGVRMPRCMSSEDPD